MVHAFIMHLEYYRKAICITRQFMFLDSSLGYGDLGQQRVWVCMQVWLNIRGSFHFGRFYHLETVSKEVKMMKLKCAHQCLKVIELIDFHGQKIEAEFIWCIINNIVALEKIVINLVSRPHKDGGFPMREFKETK